MKIGDFELNDNIMVVAEIGNNHEGSYTLAEEMIGLVAEAGSDAVKFQTFRAELYVSRIANEDRFRKLKSFELSFDKFERLSKVATDAGLIFLSTPFDLESAEALKDIVPAFKISSGDNDFYPLIEKIAGFCKPVILSSGLADLAQLQKTKNLIERTWRDCGREPGLAVLHCVSSYPVAPAEANLNAIGYLKNELGCTVGYSDHTIGIEAAVLSAAAGARIIEKHFTIDKNYSDFRDHQLSADPEEFGLMVQKIRQAEEYMGKGEKIVQESEKANAPLMRRSIAAKNDLAAGTIISADDITWVRPSGGLRPGDESLILGKQLCKSLESGQKITIDDFVSAGVI